MRFVTSCLMICLVAAPGFADTRKEHYPPSVHSLLRASRDALGNGEMDDAVGLALTAVESDPAFVDAWKQYGRARMLRGIDPETLDAFNKAWLLNPSWTDEVAVWRIQTMLGLERFELFHLMIEDMPEEGMKHFQLSEVIRWLGLLLDEGREEVAVTLARSKASVVEDPAISSLLHALADFSDYETDSVPRSVPAWSASSLEAQQIGGMLYHHAGRRASYRNQSEDAHALLDQAVAVDSSRHGAMGDKGWQHFQDGQAEAGIEVWRREIKTGAAHPDTWMTWVGEAAAATGNLHQAMAWANKALAENEFSQEAITLKLFVLLQRGKVNRIALFESSFDDNDVCNQARVDARVRFARSLGDDIDLEARLEQLRGLTQDGNVLYDVYLVLAEQARGHDRRVILEAALKLSPNDSVGLYRYGWVQWKDGYTEEAVALWTLALEDEIDGKRDRLLHVFSVLVDSGMEDEAVDLFEYVLSDKPYFDFSLDLIDEGHLSAAVFAMNKSGRIVPEINKGDKDAQVYALYQFIVEQVPSSKVWVNLIQLSEKKDKPARTDSLLKEALSVESLDPAVRARLESYQARREGKINQAILSARHSLAHDDSQRMLRAELFDLLVAEGRYKEAGIQVVRVEEELPTGGTDARLEYADLLIKMGRHQQGEAIWNSTRNRSQYSVRHAMETAAYLEQLCRVDDAVDVLNGLIKSGVNDARAYALMADFELSLGNYQDAIKAVDQGLSIAPASSLYRQRAELSEITFDWLAGKSNAVQCLEYDSGYVQMQRLASRAMLAMQEYDETVEWNLPSVERNEMFLQGHLDLRNAYTRLGKYRDALNHAEMLHEKQENDPEAIRRLAITYAENKRLPRGLDLIEPLADLRINQAIPIVMFKNVSGCDVHGRNNSEQVSEQIQLLSEAGYQFTAPDDISFDSDKDGERIIMVIVNPDAASFQQLDTMLKKVGGKAVLAVNVPAFRQALFDEGSSLSFTEAVASGRWFPAATGPANLKRVQIRGGETLTGNPLTHRIRVNNKLETLVQMEQRLDKFFAELAQDLPEEFPVLVYPFGDYGQLSLDCIPGEVRVLREVVGRHFKAAIAHGDSGFIIPGYDPLRIPAKSIPAPAFIETTSFEGTTALPDYLRPRNPILRAKFDIAKLLYWHRQYQRANTRFSEVYELGADPASVLFNWGANAFRQGDLPTALERLRRAREIGSLDQEKVLDALYQAENLKSPRLKLQVSGWDDSDDREYTEWGGLVDLFLRDDLRLGVFYNDIKHERKGIGEEDGMRAGIDAKWFFMPERWLTAKIWLMDFDSSAISDHIGGTINLHSECRWLNGHIELEYSRDQIQTVEAVREETLGDIFRLRAYSFLADHFDLYLNGDFIARTDDNDTWFAGGRIMYRVMDWPYVGIGYRGRIGDSDMDSGIYYAPEELERHTLFVSLRGTFKQVNLSASGEWGQAREENGEWIDVWSARAQAEIRVYRELKAVGGLSHLETPTYELDTFNLGLQVRF